MSAEFRIVWVPSAVNDLEEIVDYISDRDSAREAKQVGRRLLSRVDSLQKHSKRGRVLPELQELGVTSYREAILSPYRIIFRIEPSWIQIVGVLDGRRDLQELLLNRYLQG